MRSASLARNLLVVDEVHASDAYMSEILAAVLDAHLGAGGYALLMSATLGATARHRWLGGDGNDAPTLAEAIDAPYPTVSTSLGMADAGENDRRKDVSISAEPEMRDFGAVAARALAAARAGAKALVVRNTVNYAIRTQEALLEAAGPDDAGLLFSVNGVPALHHGRYAAGDRELLDDEIERRLGKDDRPDGGLVVIGTQTLEQSLDIDADLLITDLCPADVLLQRIGRLHRHRQNDAGRPDGYGRPRCVVLTPPDGDLAPLLSRGQNANGLGPHGGVYEDLRILQATLQLIVENPQWDIPAMNRELVEQATHPTSLATIEEMGEEWRDHGIKVKGGEIGDWQTARNAIIKRDKSFFTDNREVCFPSDDEQIRTRLGDDRVEITFSPEAASPFDALLMIDRLSLSVRWLGGAEVPQSVEPTMVDGGGFEFGVGEQRFRYDRLGLRRA